MEKDMNNSYLRRFCQIMTGITGMQIVPKNVNPSEGRSYYIQAPKPGCPMLLNHYRDNYMGLYAIDMHQDDYTDIISGKVDPQVYIDQAHWLVGYFRGGGDMISGGNYWPFDVVGQQGELRKMLKIMSCKTSFSACHHEPDAKMCQSCWVRQSCTFCPYGTRVNEKKDEDDPRISLLRALYNKFDRRFGPEYAVRGFTCSTCVPKDEAWLTPQDRYESQEPYTLRLYVSDELIRDLLMRETVPTDWEEFAKKLTFRIRERDLGYTVALTKENIEKAFEGLDHAQKPEPEPEHEETPVKEQNWLTRFWESFKRYFHQG